MMKAEVRRCRRCKRKRLDDEPPEVRQYKTCAKCRIIERNKKNSRKPLAEETMLYGLKQFREQASSDNYLEEEGLLKDEFFKRFHNKPFNYEAELQQVLNNPNYVSPVINNPHNDNTPRESMTSQQYTFRPSYSSGGTSQTAPTTSSSSNQGITPVVSKFQTYQQPKIINLKTGLVQTNRSKNTQTLQQQQHQQHQQQQQYQQSQAYTSSQNNRHELYDGPEEDIFEEIFKLGNKEELDENVSYSKTDIDPYLYKNVTSDYQQFLLNLLHKRQAGENMKNLVYLKEYNDEFTDNLGRYDANSNTGTRLTNVRYGEKQLRMHLQNNLKSLYIEPIIATINLPYNQDSTNLNDFRSSASIKNIYNFNSPNSSTNKVYSKIKSSSIYLNYNRKYNLLIIKVNHFVFKPSTQTYSGELKGKVRELYKKLEYQNNLQLNGVKSIDYDSHTGSVVYDKLFTFLDVYPDSLVKEIKNLNKEDFISDFVNFSTVFKADDNEVNGGTPQVEDHEAEKNGIIEEEEEEEEEEDIAEGEEEAGEDDEEEDDEEEEDSEDDLEDDLTINNDGDISTITFPASTITIPEQPPQVAKESTAEIVDPVFKPE
ncbi:hypothetical protein DFJ63DRAFT_332577 [Scheffersomyces coipomensis]|uniref:uncharacterized protein n=1 Tax=Scheffersomyces coipomensis TaxID=1788519 RepID=UPI00315DA4C8